MVDPIKNAFIVSMFINSVSLSACNGHVSSQSITIWKYGVINIDDLIIFMGVIEKKKTCGLVRGGGLCNNIKIIIIKGLS